ncbi:MAG: DEAD/DEAH box helicase family protein [Acidobacteria bacterium]|nr:DEAD/DEAH box helicase family protein [Acidobacteriota bacterium]
MRSSRACTAKRGEGFCPEYGQVIVDECHHISAFTFEQVMKQVKAKYVVGLTATPTRKDGHHPIIYMQCGPTRFSMSARTMTETTPFECTGFMICCICSVIGQAFFFVQSIAIQLQILLAVVLR